MEELKQTATVDLVKRLNQIDIEKQNLDIEWNKIVNELWNRIPTLKDSVDIQPKKVKEKKI